MSDMSAYIKWKMDNHNRMLDRLRVQFPDFDQRYERWQREGGYLGDHFPGAKFFSDPEPKK